MTTSIQDGATAAESASVKTDECIESTFDKTYIYQIYLKDDNISIRSRNGKVTLTGSVIDDYHKSMAEHTAEALFGVTSVDNQIQVIGEPIVEASDRWIHSKVKMELLLNQHVSASKTEVEVKNGAVILRGEAASQAQKELTTEFAKDVDGVTDVINDMTVAASTPTNGHSVAERMGVTVREVIEFIDDASVTAQVRMSLLLHRSTSAMKTKVETKDGQVILSGVAKNSAEKDLVTKLVNAIRGAKSVINNMVIETPIPAGK